MVSAQALCVSAAGGWTGVNSPLKSTHSDAPGLSTDLWVPKEAPARADLLCKGRLRRLCGQMSQILERGRGSGGLGNRQKHASFRPTGRRKDPTPPHPQHHPRFPDLLGDIKNDSK